MDPVPLVLGAAAAGSIVGKLTERFTEYLVDLFKGQDDAVQQRANENASAFLSELAHQVERIERVADQAAQERIVNALSDPDVAASVKTAVIGAARSSSKEKHQVLAQAVAERLAAEPESAQAVASSLAIEAIPRLSSAHLRFLGLCAVVFLIRPFPQWYRPVRDGSLRSEDIPSYDSYTSWLIETLQRFHLEVELRELQIAHLVSVGCVIYERKLFRDLYRTLSFQWELDDDAWMVKREVGEFLHLNRLGRDLLKLWSFGLQHVTLTPVGQLIGAAMYEAVGGHPLEVQWSQQTPPDEYAIQDTAWDGNTIHEEFLRALERAVQDRAERGVGPWKNLDHT